MKVTVFMVAWLGTDKWAGGGQIRIGGEKEGGSWFFGREVYCLICIYDAKA